MEGDSDVYSVDKEKIIGYLLNMQHPEGQSKAAFFRAMGFTENNWEDLRQSLLLAGKRGITMEQVQTKYGEKIVRVHEIMAPSGMNRLVRTVWFRAKSTVGWRLVSAYPERRA